MNISKTITVQTPGTCGELVQGMINNQNFLVTCPVDMFSYVTVSLDRQNSHIKYPRGKWKSKKAIEKTLNFFQQGKTGVEIRIKSEIPIGKGMSSSTADIVGGCSAMTSLLEKKITEKEIADIAISIEPSDGTMFKGITVFDHREGEIIEKLGEPPQIKILAIDPDGTVDTIEFNKTDFSRVRKLNEKQIKEAVELVREGIKKKNKTLIGKAATMSAVCNQSVLFKPELEDIIKVAEEFNSLGVNVAHSGTVVGILLEPDFADMNSLKKKIQEKIYRKKLTFYETNLIGGESLSDK